MPIQSATFAPASAASQVLQAGSTVAMPLPVTAASSANSTADLITAIKPFTPDALANGFATLVGALVGAMLAFALQRHFQKSLEHRNDLTSAHRLMFSLLQQINTIVLIQRDYIYSELSNPVRFLSINATPPYDTAKNVLQLRELAFLLNSKESRAILYDFYIAQENYVEAINQWNMRSALHLEKVQPALASSSIENGSEVTQEQLRAAIGAHTFGWIFNSTNNSIEALSRAFQKLAEVKVKTRKYLVQRFDTDDFTDFDFLETYGLLPTDAKDRGTAA